jgi:Cu-processing system permease protein
MSPRTILLIARKEIRDALRNRWFLLYTVAFGALALAFARLSLSTTAGTAGFAGFGRTAASLVNLVLLVVPLMGLSLGATSLAAERERGTMATLLVQPVTRGEVLLGKYLGLALALASALALGFGAAGLVVAARGGAVDAAVYGRLVGFALLLALATLSIGMLISAFAGRSGAATGSALVVWLVLVFLGDLGLMGTALTLRLDVGTLLALVMANPLESFKIAAIGAITGSLDTLGPAGAYAARTWGDRLVPLLAAVLAAWILTPLLLASLVFDRRGVR